MKHLPWKCQFPLFFSSSTLNLLCRKCGLKHRLSDRCKVDAYLVCPSCPQVFARYSLAILGAYAVKGGYYKYARQAPPLRSRESPSWSPSPGPPSRPCPEAARADAGHRRVLHRRLGGADGDRDRGQLRVVRPRLCHLHQCLQARAAGREDHDALALRRRQRAVRARDGRRGADALARAAGARHHRRRRTQRRHAGETGRHRLFRLGRQEARDEERETPVHRRPRSGAPASGRHGLAGAAGFHSLTGVRHRTGCRFSRHSPWV